MWPVWTSMVLYTRGAKYGPEGGPEGGSNLGCHGVYQVRIEAPVFLGYTRESLQETDGGVKRVKSRGGHHHNDALAARPPAV